jgi:hypothetical protein
LCTITKKGAAMSISQKFLDMQIEYINIEKGEYPHLSKIYLKSNPVLTQNEPNFFVEHFNSLLANADSPHFYSEVKDEREKFQTTNIDSEYVVFGTENDINTFKESLSECSMEFSSVEEGYELLKKAYFYATTSSGEWLDDKLESGEFDIGIDYKTLYGAIQALRTWDHEADDMGPEVFSDGVNFTYFDTDIHVEKGMRVGYIDLEGGFETDSRIEASSNIAIPIEITIKMEEDGDDEEEEQTVMAMIGEYNKDIHGNDDDVFFWFAKGEEIVGDHEEFEVLSFEIVSSSYSHATENLFSEEKDTDEEISFGIKA